LRDLTQDPRYRIGGAQLTLPNDRHGGPSEFSKSA
jgi:hypothetical protein